MNFGTRSAGAGFAHLPEIIVLIAVDDVFLGQIISPIAGGFVVSLQTLFGTAFKYGCVKPRSIEFKYFGQVFPGPGYGFFFEIIAERPVAQHFEHGMMIGVVPHFFQVVVFTAHPQTFLRIGHPEIFGGSLSQKNVFKLVHSGIGKHQAGIVFDHHRCGRYYLMPLGGKEVFERFTNLFCAKHN